jgi:hypothetical protein
MPEIPQIRLPDSAHTVGDPCQNFQQAAEGQQACSSPGGTHHPFCRSLLPILKTLDFAVAFLEVLMQSATNQGLQTGERLSGQNKGSSQGYQVCRDAQSEDMMMEKIHP